MQPKPTWLLLFVLILHTLLWSVANLKAQDARVLSSEGGVDADEHLSQTINLLPLDLQGSISFGQEIVTPQLVCALRWERLVNPPILALAADTEYRGIRLRFESDDVLLLLRGVMPDARYMSLTTYRPDANAYASIFDANIKRQVDGAHYEIAVVPPGADLKNFPHLIANRLERPSVKDPGVTRQGTTLWYRVYVPYTERELLHPPTITAYSLKSGEPLPCPTSIEPSSPVNPLAVKQAATLPDRAVKSGWIDSFHVSADFDYQNKENGYLNAAIEYQHPDDVAIMRFEAPVAATRYSTLNPDASWSEADVRLFSISVVNRIGVNRFTRNDSELTITKDLESGIERTANLLLGDEKDPDLIAWARQNGYTLLPRATGWGARDLMIYRQQAANIQPLGREPFLGHVRRFVPLCTSADRQNGERCAGRCFVGSYAPRGKVCRKSELLSGRCQVDLRDDEGCQQRS